MAIDPVFAPVDGESPPGEPLPASSSHDAPMANEDEHGAVLFALLDSTW
jgi:hypothetical protein